MEHSKVAVFGTRHILASSPLYDGQPPVHQEWHRGQRLDWYSTGKLEEAVARGLEIYVVSIRPAFGPQDEWWLEIVGRERAFNAGRIFAAAVSGDPMEAAYEPWRLLFSRLGIPWPEGAFHDFDDPAIWLASRHGIRDGSLFRGHALLA